MAIQLNDADEVKNLFKQALLELFRDERQVFYDLFAEVIEDIALVNAIKAEEDSEPVTRDEVFEALQENE
ncbi:MAG: hypothetical protein KDI79_13145 [Anaerolineae bacterium]|nr:hypothetical protein [Anaerolineae bacterium]